MRRVSLVDLADELRVQAKEEGTHRVLRDYPVWFVDTYGLRLILHHGKASAYDMASSESQLTGNRVFVKRLDPDGAETVDGSVLNGRLVHE